MGKTTAGELLRKLGVEVIDTDGIARRLVEPSQPALAEIRNRFGEDMLLPDGHLDRGKLARHVFAHPAARAELEAILHPRIHEVWRNETLAWRAAGRAFGAVIIPLLFETKAESFFDATICVACSPAAQAKRLAERGWEAAQCQQRLDAQWPTERKIHHSDFVVWTNTTLEIHAAQLRRLLSQ
jgi:dephospho-CoA kinase